MNDLQLYFRYVGISVRSQLQYRGNVLLQSLGQLLMNLMEFVGIWALLARFGSLQHYTFPQVALLYGIVDTGFALCESFARGFDEFPALIKSGDFDRLLLRPRSTWLQVLSQQLHLRIGRLIQGIVILSWAAVHLPTVWSVAKIALLVGSILGTAALFTGLLVIQATLAFWTIESLEILNAATYGGVETARLPLAIYHPWFRRFFTFVIPLAFANYVPAQAFFDTPDPLGFAPIARWLAPLAGFMFLVISAGFWHLGVRKYQSTGN